MRGPLGTLLDRAEELVAGVISPEARGPDSHYLAALWEGALVGLP